MKKTQTLNAFFPTVKKVVTGQTDRGMNIIEFRDGNGELQQIMPPITHHLAAVPEQKREIYSQCCELLGVPTELGVGRPKQIEVEKIETAKTVCELNFTKKYKDSDTKDLLKSEFPHFFVEMKRDEKMLSTPISDDNLVEDEEANEIRALLDRHTSEPLRFIERSFCHIWSANGSHSGWRSFTDLNASLSAAFGYELSSSTGYRLLASEKSLLEKNDVTALKTRPDISIMLAKVAEAKTSLASLVTEPSFTDAVHDAVRGRPSSFDPSWHDDLTEEINKHSDLPGFGPLMVQAFASEIMLK